MSANRTDGGRGSERSGGSGKGKGVQKISFLATLPILVLLPLVLSPATLSNSDPRERLARGETDFGEGESRSSSVVVAGDKGGADAVGTVMRQVGSATVAVDGEKGDSREGGAVDPRRSDRSISDIQSGRDVG